MANLVPQLKERKSSGRTVIPLSDEKGLTHLCRVEETELADLEQPAFPASGMQTNTQINFKKLKPQSHIKKDVRNT